MTHTAPSAPTGAAAQQQLQQAKEQGKTVMSIAYIRRHPDLTVDQFYDHWENKHGVICKPWAEKYGLSYTQVHLKKRYNNGIPIGPENPDAAALDDFDGCAIFEIISFEQFAAAFDDEYYKTIIEPDERKFIDKKVGVMRVRGEAKRITIGA